MSQEASAIGEFVRQTFARIRRDATMTIEPSQRAAAIAQWTELINSINGIQITPHPGDRDRRSATLCRFRVSQHPGAQVSIHRDGEFRVEADRKGQLFLRTGRSLNRSGVLEMPLAGTDQIQSLVDAFSARNQAIAAEQSRLQASIDLRLRCIEASIRQSVDAAADVRAEHCDGDAVVTIVVDSRTVSLRCSLAEFATAAEAGGEAARLAMQLAGTPFEVNVSQLMRNTDNGVSAG